jgi:DNA-binding transcriptional LysR family regulator
MHDLNDLYYFVQVVDHGGFAPAGRALGEPKSKLSRRIALLEEHLGVRLIQRSTRHFLTTEIGQSYYAHCKAMLVEADAAQAAVEQTRSEPSGIVRLTCPVALLHARVSVMLAGFMAHYPQVEVHLEATNRRVDLIAGARPNAGQRRRTSETIATNDERRWKRNAKHTSATTANSSSSFWRRLATARSMSAERS